MDRKTREDNQMAITPDRVREIFKGLENGDGAASFEHVVDDVDWTVIGHPPLAGHYLSKKPFIVDREKAHDKISAIGISVSQGKGRLIDLLTEESEIRKIFRKVARSDKLRGEIRRHRWIAFSTEGKADHWLH
jgi:hypothetical protein